MLDFFIIFYIQKFSGRFDTSGSMIPLSVSEIATGPALDGFCDEEHEQQQYEEQEWGILVVGYINSIIITVNSNDTPGI